MAHKASADPSRKAVYDWEDSWPDWETRSLSLRQCRSLVALACKAYGVDMVPVRAHKRGMAYSVTYTPPHGSHISFVPKHQNKPIALHEAAHHIASRLYGALIQDHGPEWQGVYFFLLARADIAPRVALQASVAPFGLQWHETPPCPKHGV